MSHVLRVGVADQIAYFRAYNTDGSANASLTASTTGLTLSVFRVGASSVSIASLSNKAADNTAHADGAIRNVGGNLYTIDLPDAACATQVPSICVRGSYTGGVIEGLEHPIVAYDPSVVAVGANTTTPPTAAANASQVRTELTTELARIDVATSTRLASGSYTSPPTAATVASAVWDKATVDHTSTGSFGAAVGALLASSGSGARTVTITVNDGTTALQNARVRMTEGANTYVALTNASGVATFNLDDATYVVSITKQGYSYAGTTLVVDGTEAVTYSMSVVTITASDVDKVTGYWTVLDEDGNEASGIVVTVKARQANRASSGVLHDAAERTATSAVNGLVQFPNMIPGWRYSVVANDEYVADFVVPANAVTSVELGSIVARLS